MKVDETEFVEEKKIDLGKKKYISQVMSHKCVSVFFSSAAATLSLTALHCSRRKNQVRAWKIDLGS